MYLYIYLVITFRIESNFSCAQFGQENWFKLIYLKKSNEQKEIDTYIYLLIYIYIRKFNQSIIHKQFQLQFKVLKYLKDKLAFCYCGFLYCFSNPIIIVKVSFLINFFVYLYKMKKKTCNCLLLDDLLFNLNFI